MNTAGGPALWILALASILSTATREAPAFEVIAHRGASAEAPENTLAAFERALAQGALHLELDVQLSRDRKVVVFHDRELSKKTGARGVVGDYDLAFLHTLDLAPWFAARRSEANPQPAETVLVGDETAITGLAEVFRRFGKRPVYHVEIKGRNAELPDRVTALIREFGLTDRVRVSSFELVQLRKVSLQEPSLFLCWLLPRAKNLEAYTRHYPELSSRSPSTFRRLAVDRAVAEGFAQVGVSTLELDAELVEYARTRGVVVRVWRVPNLALLKRAHALGASGATVDWPGRALEWLREHEASTSSADPNQP